MCILIYIYMRVRSCMYIMKTIFIRQNTFDGHFITPSTKWQHLVYMSVYTYCNVHQKKILCLTIIAVFVKVAYVKPLVEENN